MSSQDQTPKQAAFHRLDPTALREKQANVFSGRAATDVSSIKTPNGQLLKNAGKPSVRQTPQNDKSATENLSHSAKSRALLNRLKATNAALAGQGTTSSSASSSLTSHQLAHQNLSTFQNTPKRQMIPSTPSNDSAKDAKKSALPVAKPVNVSAIISKALEHRPFGTPGSVSSSKATAPSKATATSYLTPNCRPAASKYSSSSSSSSANTSVSFNTSKLLAESQEVNPVWNGVDYSHMIAQKAQLGYTGPGYIVEFDCNEKYLKGLLIRKGLWKVTTSENKARDSTLSYLGPPIFLSRVDVEGERNTPSRNNLTKFDFNWRQRFNTVAKSSDIASGNSTTHSLNLETKSHQKVKKQIRWAIDPLESITENTSSASASSPALATPGTSRDDAAASQSQQQAQQVNIMMMPSLDTPLSSNQSNSNNSSRKSLRRSLSLGDMNEYMVDEYECAYAIAGRSVHLSPLVDQSMSDRHDATFDLERPQYVGRAPVVDVTKSSPCHPTLEIPMPCGLHDESEIKYTPSLTTTESATQKSELHVPGLMMVRSVSATSATSDDSIGFAPASTKSNDDSIKLPTAALDNMNLSAKDMSIESSSKHSLSLLNDDHQTSQDKAESASASSGLNSNNLSLELTGGSGSAAAVDRDHVLVNELAAVSGAIQEMTSKLAKDPYFSAAMQDFMVPHDANSSLLKSKLKKIKAESSLEFVRFFNQLDLAEKLIGACKANLSL